MSGIPEDATFEEPELACMLESLQKGKKGSGNCFRRGKKGWSKGEFRDILKAGKGSRPENYKQVRWKLQSDRLNIGWKDQQAHGTNKRRGNSQLAQMDDLLARTRCFKCGELGHLSKECHQNKETTTNSETFFSGMVYINSCNVHPRNRLWADRCRDNSCAGAVRSNCTRFSQDDSAGVSRGDPASVSRGDCAGVSRTDSRICDSRNESRADDDSRNEPTMYFDSRNGRCAEVDFQQDDETFLDVRKDEVTFLDVQTDGVTLPVPCSSSSFSLGSVVVVGPRENVCSDMKFESDGGTDDSKPEPLAKSVEMKRLVGIAVANGTPIRVAYKDVRRRMRIEARRQKELDEGVEPEVVLDSFLDQVKVEQQQQSGPLKRVLTPSAKAAKHRRARDKKLRETLCWWIANDKVCPHGDRCNFRHTVSETGALLPNPAPEQTMCGTGVSWPSLATEQDKNETGVLSPGPSTSPTHPRSPTRDSWNNSWDRYEYRDKWTDVWKRITMATDGFMAGTSTTTAMTGRMLGESVILALCVNTMMTTRQMRGASANLMMCGVRVTWKPAVGARAIGRRADGTIQTSAATIARNRCFRIVVIMRLRILATIAIDPLFEIIRTIVAINSCTSPRSHFGTSSVPPPTTMGADPASAFFFWR